MSGTMKKLYAWVDERVHLEDLVKFALTGKAGE